MVGLSASRWDHKGSVAAARETTKGRGQGREVHLGFSPAPDCLTSPVWASSLQGPSPPQERQEDGRRLRNRFEGWLLNTVRIGVVFFLNVFIYLFFG